MKLSLGAGYSHEPGWTTLDINPATKPDIVGRAYPLDLPDASVDEMRAVDVLEHISYRETDAALAEWARVLRPHVGRLYVQVPDAGEIITWKVAYPDRLIERLPAGLTKNATMGMAWRLLGGHADGDCVREGDDWRWNAHYSLWTIGHLVESLERAGLEVVSVETNAHPNLLCHAVKR